MGEGMIKIMHTREVTNADYLLVQFFAFSWLSFSCGFAQHGLHCILDMLNTLASLTGTRHLVSRAKPFTRYEDKEMVWSSS